MFAIKAELKTKGLVLGNGPLLHRAFMKFRGPKALNDKLPVSTTYRELTANCPSFCKNVYQSLRRNIDIEIYGYFAPLITRVLANHDVVGMTLLVA